MTTIRMILREWCNKITKVQKENQYYVIHVSSKESGLKVYNRLIETFGSATVPDYRINNDFTIDIHKEAMKLLIGKIIMEEI